jgi:hypothetical protein
MLYIELALSPPLRRLNSRSLVSSLRRSWLGGFFFWIYSEGVGSAVVDVVVVVIRLMDFAAVSALRTFPLISETRYCGSRMPTWKHD